MKNTAHIAIILLLIIVLAGCEKYGYINQPPPKTEADEHTPLIIYNYFEGEPKVMDLLVEAGEEEEIYISYHNKHDAKSGKVNITCLNIGNITINPIIKGVKLKPKERNEFIITLSQQDLVGSDVCNIKITDEHDNQEKHQIVIKVISQQGRW